MEHIYRCRSRIRPHATIKRTKCSTCLLFSSHLSHHTHFSHPIWNSDGLSYSLLFYYYYYSHFFFKVSKPFNLLATDGGSGQMRNFTLCLHYWWNIWAKVRLEHLLHTLQWILSVVDVKRPSVNQSEIWCRHKDSIFIFKDEKSVAQSAPIFKMNWQLKTWMDKDAIYTASNLMCCVKCVHTSLQLKNRVCPDSDDTGV